MPDAFRSALMLSDYFEFSPPLCDIFAAAFIDAAIAPPCHAFADYFDYARRRFSPPACFALMPYISPVSP